jgi:hypothetical protein
VLFDGCWAVKGSARDLMTLFWKFIVTFLVALLLFEVMVTGSTNSICRVIELFWWACAFCLAWQSAVSLRSDESGRQNDSLW